MKKIDKLKLALKKILIEFRSLNTDKAVISWDGEDDIAEGIIVYVTDEEGNRSLAEDGEYVDEEKITYVIENGLVKEIIPAPDEEPEEQPEAPAEEQNEPEEENPEQPADEPVEDPVDERVDDEIGTDAPEEEVKPVEEPAPEEPATIADEVEEVVEEANDFKDRIDALVERIASLEEEILRLKEFKATVEEMTASKPAHQEFNQVKVDSNLGKNKDLSNLTRLF